ncbi:NDP-hexose 2,3-dehydratase family protein [Micromonospora echinospora]|uniref:NDP-hexose 2,3-dehydratase family protein n=1 Tax=Micromonospora echinospora TaxID=1877 RepID=UPI003CF80DA9
MALPQPVRGLDGLAEAFELSARTDDSPVTPLRVFDEWFAQRNAAERRTAVRIPFDELVGWSFHPETGNLTHETGRFFSIEGLRVQTDRPWIGRWAQPIIVQPEIGILGILVKRIGGILHCLMQAKMEPGNVNGVQLSPTVQATRSNYVGVHGGGSVPYLAHFVEPGQGTTLVDVLQSEQGAWFLHKRNRNMIVETTEDVPLAENFRWLTLGQIHRLMRRDHVVNMDARTVLACVPAPSGDDAYAASTRAGPPDDGEPAFAARVRASLSGRGTPLSDTRAVLSWLTSVRARHELVQRRVGLNSISDGGWRHQADEICHVDGKYFRVIAVDVRAGDREVASWTQPLVAPIEPGLLALLVKPINGILHALVQARVDAGTPTVAEIGPTVQCSPVNYRDVPVRFRPAHLDYALGADPASVRYDVMQSEEGGRFHHARNRYLVIEVDADFPTVCSPDHHWVTLHQLADLLLHHNYLNIELRSLIACIRAVGAGREDG